MRDFEEEQCMEKMCSVCGAPMIRTENGYKCSFCAHSELLGESNPYENSNKWITYTSDTETEEPRAEMPQNDSLWNALPREEEQPVTPFNDVMVEVPMGNEPKVFNQPEQPDLSRIPKQISKNKPIWKKIIKIYVIVMVAQAVIPVLFFLVSGFIGAGLSRDRGDLEITIDKSKFPTIKPIEVPVVDFEMPEIEVIMPDLDYLKETQEDEDWYSSATMQAALTKIFGKPIEEVTLEDLHSIQYFMVEVDEEMTTMEVQYSTEDYSLYPEEYSDENVGAENMTFGYNEEFVKTIQTVTVPFEKDLVSVYMDMEKFKNVKAINICYLGYADLSKFPQLTMLDGGTSPVDVLLSMHMPTDQIEVLKLNTTFLNGLDQFTGVKNLHIDGNDQIVSDLTVLGNMPWLEELTIKDTLINDVNFLKGIPELRSLRLINNKLITDKTGLDSLENLENLMIQ